MPSNKIKFLDIATLFCVLLFVEGLADIIGSKIMPETRGIIYKKISYSIMIVTRLFQIVLILLYARFFMHLDLKSCNITLQRPIRQIKWALGLSVLLGIGALIAQFFSKEFLRFDFFKNIAGYDPYLKDPSYFLLMLLILGVVAPMSEELFFRGILYSWLRLHLKFIFAVVISALIFSLFHLLAGNIIPYTQFIGGILFAIAMEKGRGILSPILIHSAGNVSMMLLSFVYKG